MAAVFDERATLDVVVRTDGISVPPTAAGRAAIAEVLVREFGKTYENFRTFCLSSPPEPSRESFSCRWLVGMSTKED